MNPSYFRIKLNKEEALERLCTWNEKKIKEKIETDFSNAVSVSLNEHGQWKGSCLYVYEKEGWTIFEDLFGGYSLIGAENWKIFAEDHSLVVAGYNDSIIYAELVVIENGIIQKNFVECDDAPEDNVNKGTEFKNICNWIDVASFIDHDELVYSDNGTVIIF